MTSPSQNPDTSRIIHEEAGGVTTDCELLAHCKVQCGKDEYVHVSRFLVDKKDIKYITVRCTNFEFDYPPFPLGDWNVGQIKDCPQTGEPIFTYTESRAFVGVSNVWNPTTIEYSELSVINWIASEGRVKDNVALVTHPLLEKPAIMKIAVLPDHFEAMERETKAQQLIHGKDIGPKFLGHVAESGRVIGFLSESIEGAVEMDPSSSDACFEALTRLHTLGIFHGDVHPGNFLCKGDKVLIIDFEYARFNPTEKDFELDIHLFNNWL